MAKKADAKASRPPVVAPAAPALKASKAAKRRARSNGQPEKKVAPAPDPLAPRLGRAEAAPNRQTLERELKRTKTRLAEIEKRIADTEQAVKSTEAEMAAPGFYDDRDRSSAAAEGHQKLMWEAGDLMSQWEALQAEVDEKTEQLSALAPAPAPAPALAPALALALALALAPALARTGPHWPALARTGPHWPAPARAGSRRGR